METKKCCKCKEIKPLNEFHKNITRKDGHNPNCKICNREYIKQYRDNHRKEIKEYNKQYYDNHREEINEYAKQYRKDNREKINEWCKNRYKYNKKNNLCINCRKQLYTFAIRCPECLKKQRIYNSITRQKYKDNGLCIKCGQHPPQIGYTTCNKCRERMNVNARIRHHGIDPHELDEDAKKLQEALKNGA